MEPTCCYGVYERTRDGRWLYPWGQPVPGARDVTLRDVLRLGLARAGGDTTAAALEEALRDDPLVDLDAQDAIIDLDDDATLDRVVGMDAPELHVRSVMTISDIANLIGVATDTVAAYRYRGYLPEPQAIIARTPVWSRPVVQHWLETRPGNGWRTDIYGDRAEYDEQVRRRRAARQQRRSHPTVA